MRNLCRSAFVLLATLLSAGTSHAQYITWTDAVLQAPVATTPLSSTDTFPVIQGVGSATPKTKQIPYTALPDAIFPGFSTISSTVSFSAASCLGSNIPRATDNLSFTNCITVSGSGTAPANLTPVYFTGPGSVPAPLQLNQEYWVINSAQSGGNYSYSLTPSPPELSQGPYQPIQGSGGASGSATATLFPDQATQVLGGLANRGLLSWAADNNGYCVPVLHPILTAPPTSSQKLLCNDEDWSIGADALFYTSTDPSALAGINIASVTGTPTVTLTFTFGASFTGSISGDQLTASSIIGTIGPGSVILGTGVPANTMVISGTSSPFTISTSGTVGSEAMTVQLPPNGANCEAGCQVSFTGNTSFDLVAGLSNEILQSPNLFNNVVGSQGEMLTNNPVEGNCSFASGSGGPSCLYFDFDANVPIAVSSSVSGTATVTVSTGCSAACPELYDANPIWPTSRIPGGVIATAPPPASGSNLFSLDIVGPGADAENVPYGLLVADVQSASSGTMSWNLTTSPSGGGGNINLYGVVSIYNGSNQLQAQFNGLNELLLLGIPSASSGGGGNYLCIDGNASVYQKSSCP